MFFIVSQLLPFESRLLHCSADEIVLRRLHTGLKMSAEQEEEIEQWVETIMGETPLRNNNHSAQNPSPTASSPLSTTAATNLTVAPSSPSPAPRIPPLRLCFHLLSSLILPNRSRRTHTEHERIDQLGHLLGLLAERVLLEERIERSLQALPSSDRSAALNITRAIGSTTPLQRIMIRHKEVTERFTSVLKQFYANTTEGGENNTVDNKLQSMKLNLAASTTPANAASDLSMKELNSTTDFPSTVLVAQLLARRGVLPGRNATAITNNDGVLRLPYANLTANQLPANSSYSPAHFLSSSSIPLLELSTLKSNKNYQSETMSQPSNSSSSLSSLPSASDVHPSSALFDCNLDREMFLKAAHKSLNYTIEK